uniref:Retinitis pigmentosa 9 protein n=1 Tax=Strix occidentalis caurina TaxID=311401 RepID=A0A8D0EG67_STROC
MPLGKEVKVMQCWRCKRYGHRTGDKECPFFIKGNQKLEQFRVAHEDPMYDLIRENKRHEKEMSSTSYLFNYISFYVFSPKQSLKRSHTHLCHNIQVLGFSFGLGLKKRV